MVHATAIIPYQPNLGIEYARKYYLNGNPNFYRATDDCTNFISQCIWAAYGGWSPAMSDAEVKKNIRDGFRMVKGSYTGGWYANQGGGSRAWENVDYLWSFMTYQKSYGPKATGENSGKLYTNINPKDIHLGNVMQFSLNGWDYHHNTYVIAVDPNAPSFDNIYVAQHTANKIRTLSDAIANNGGDRCYMRKMTFHSTTF